MRKLAYIALLSTLLLSAGFGCGSGGGGSDNNEDIPAIRNYIAYNIGNGDLFNLVIDDDVSTMSYNNYTTSATANANFTESNGLIETDNENFSSLYESPLVGLVINSTDSLSLATSNESFTLNDIFGASYNIMQFRNQIGGHGIEIACAVVSDQGTLTQWAYRPGEPDETFSSETTDLNEIPFVQDGNFMTFTGDEGESVYMFGANDFYVFAIPNGPNFMFVQQAQSAFNTAWSGNYHVMLYSAPSATMIGQTESGSITFNDGSAIVSASGNFTLNIEGSTQTHALIPMSSSNFVGTGKIENSCNGMFTFQDDSGANVFVSFVDKIFLYARYLQIDSGTYSYSYGMGTLQ